MNRRGFIQISAAALLPVLIGIFPRNRDKEQTYSIKVDSNRSFGHKLRESFQVAPTRFSETDYVIVGGGIAGMAAALMLDGLNYRLFEGDKYLGGSSAASSWKTVRFATGAHYELAYPKNFGKELIDELLKMNVIYWNEENQLYQFVDRQYVIKSDKAEQCFVAHEQFEEVLDGVDGIEAFNELMKGFVGKMPLPTRLIEQKHHHLNEISFARFLTDNLKLNPDLKQRIDYQMIDDWGAKSDEISALAGIHYYTCRPYYEKDVELFSPPNGNAYFIEKMVGQLSTVQPIETETMVKAIRKVENGVEVEVYHPDGKVEQVLAKGVIYAGQKHSLKYILPEAAPLFDNTYVPWVILNIVCDKTVSFEKWQNDVVTDNLEFLGFVDSGYQKQESDTHKVLTVYYCFDSNNREYLVEIEQEPEVFVQETIRLIESETDYEFSDKIEHVELKIRGHAMAIPKPGYLSFNNIPNYSSKIVFAGVDTGRLPLFTEAFDSGLQAGKQIIKNVNANS